MIDGRDQIKLADLLNLRLDDNELDELAVVLNMDGHLGDGTRKAKALRLVQYMNRRQAIDTLCGEIKQHRPDLAEAIEQLNFKPKPRRRRFGPVAIGVVLVCLLGLLGLLSLFWGNDWRRDGAETFLYHVQVQDGDTAVAIERATVLLMVAQNVPQQELSDTHGSVIFVLNKSLQNEVARITVQKSGYAPVEEWVNLQPDRLPHKILLLQSNP